jgi:hypothetical protein
LLIFSKIELTNKKYMRINIFLNNEEKINGKIMKIKETDNFQEFKEASCKQLEIDNNENLKIYNEEGSEIKETKEITYNDNLFFSETGEGFKYLYKKTLLKITVICKNVQENIPERLYFGIEKNVKLIDFKTNLSKGI